MKLLILMLTLLTLISCGKKNESGKSSPAKSTSAYTAEEEEAIRQGFISKGKELLRFYDYDLKNILGARTVGLIRNKLRMERVMVSDRLLIDASHRYSRAVHHDNFVTLYIGHEEPALSWGQFQNWRLEVFNRLVMHELLEMGNVDDQNFIYTDRILNRR